VGGSISVSQSKSNTDTGGLDITNTWTETFSIVGQDADGIDHNQDEIWIWFGPQFDVTVVTTGASVGIGEQKQVSYNLRPGEGEINFLTIGELNGSRKIDDAYMNFLRSYQITEDDFANILRADPLATQVCQNVLPRPPEVERLMPEQVCQTVLSVPDPSRYSAMIIDATRGPTFKTCPYHPVFGSGPSTCGMS
jgi:hypothetical protein